MLKVENLYKSFDTVDAVRGLSFHVEEGEIFGLLGPNGAGKSTTITMIAGLVEPSRGTVMLKGGVPPHHRNAKRAIGYIPQELALYGSLTARENLSFFASLYGMRGKVLKEKVAWALEFSRLKDKADLQVGTFSGGMKRRLNIAAALMHGPELVLMDEPTVGVDAQSRNAIFDSIQQLRREGMTIIYTTHYMEEAERLCDRVAIVDGGELKALGTVEGLKEEHCEGVIIGLEGAGGRREIRSKQPVQAIIEADREEPVLRLTVENPTLEEVFLKVTGRKLRE